MKRWTYGINSLYKTGSIGLSSGPFWVFWAEDLAQWICGHVPAIPFPAWGKVTDEGETYNWREWFGDLHQFFHLKVDMPIFEWAERTLKQWHFEIGYDKLREAFYDENREFWDESETLAVEWTKGAG